MTYKNIYKLAFISFFIAGISELSASYEEPYFDKDVKRQQSIMLEKEDVSYRSTKAASTAAVFFGGVLPSLIKMIGSKGKRQFLPYAGLAGIFSFGFCSSTKTWMQLRDQYIELEEEERLIRAKEEEEFRREMERKYYREGVIPTRCLYYGRGRKRCDDPWLGWPKD